MAANNKEAAAAVSHVDQASGVPLYLQVERILAHRIESGEWHPGEQIPNETKLCAQYGLSRVTMRQAVARLVSRGLLAREQGRGTFVRDPSLIAGSRRVTSFTAELEELGIKAGGHVLSHEVTTAARAAAVERLRLPDDANVLSLRRVRTGNGAPIGLQTCVLPLDRFPGLENLDFEGRSLYATLEEIYGVVAVEAFETFTVGGAEAVDAETLQVPCGSYVFNVERLSFDSTGPFEYVRSVMRGDRYQIRLVLRRP
jgi:GntR family transcriptional regulator